MQQTQPQAGRAGRPRIYHGWLIVACSFITNAVVFGAGTASFSVFMTPMTQALGWSRATFTGAVTLQSLLNLIVAPISGMIVDRFGPRLVMVFGACVATVCYMILGHITEPWQFYIVYAGAVSLGLHEMGSLITSVVVSKWFIRKRGRALAFMATGNNVGSIVFAPFSAYLIDTLGWQAAWAVLGLCIAVLVLPPTIAIMRRTPEDMGLLPDGDLPATAAVSATDRGTPPPPRRTEVDWTLREALHTPALWLMVVSTNLSALAFASSIHLVPYFQDIGLPLQTATFVFALNHISGFTSKLVWGFIAEHVPVRYCLMGNYLGRALGLIILVFGGGVWRAYGYAVISGILSNAFPSLQPQAWADYYGRAFLGTIRGVLTPFSLMASIGGPLFAAFVFDKAGSYDLAFNVFTVTLIIAAVVLYFAPPPKKPVKAPPEQPQSVAA